MVELRQLRNFLMVAEMENLRKAGERLHLDQSVLSRSIRDLEEDLGFSLFERLPRGVRLTDAGRVYADSIQSVFDTLDRAMQLGKRSALGQVGTLNVGISEICTHYPMVTTAIRSFREQFPQVELKLIVLRSAQQLTAFSRNELDASFHVGPPQDLHRLTFMELLTDRMGLVVPREHRLASMEQVCLTDLADEAFIGHAAPSPFIHARLREDGFTPRADLVVSSIDAVVSLVSAGLGIAFLAESVRDRASAHVVFKRIADYEIPLQVCLVTPSHNRSPALDNFLETVLAVQKRSPD